MTMRDEPQLDGSDLDATVRRVDPDRWLSSRFVADPHVRGDVIAIYAYDHELARAPKVASNPILGEIRLTWWSEALDEIYEGRPVRRHPTAQALAHAVHHWSLPREPLQAMIDARERQLDPTPMTEAEALAWAAGTAGAAAQAVARVLDPNSADDAARSAGQAWAISLRTRDEPSLRPAAQRLIKSVRDRARDISVAAFPAVAHAALARAYAAGKTPTELRKRLRLTLAVATGRL